MIKIFLLLSVYGTLLSSSILEYKISTNKELLNKQENIKILDAKELKFRSKNNIQVTELSALAYKDSILYALGDKGILFSFEINIEENKIKKLALLDVLELKNKKSKVLKKSDTDSEGLCFIGKDLLISFEKNPRVDVFSTAGIKIQKKKIHKDLKKEKKYRSKNKALESITYNRHYGVITAPQMPLKGLNKEKHIIYAKNKTWKIPVSGNITALEFMSQNKLMILEKTFNEFSRRRVITISSLNLENSEYKVLAKLDSREGWNLDNFEGLTKIAKNKYLMISDDNNSFFQKTLLVLFEVN